MDAITRIGYWRHVLMNAFLACFRRGVALGFAILIAVAIAIYQNLHHVSIATDGWWVFLKPYTFEFSAWFVLQVAESCWNSYRETSKQFAKLKIAQLDNQGAWLQGKAPIQGNANESIFCQFWAEEARNWSDQICKLLWDNYGETVARDFTSNVGINPAESLGTVHPEAAAAYRTLVHQRKTLQNIRRILS
jgi:hypothetical protein